MKKEKLKLVVVGIVSFIVGWCAMYISNSLIIGGFVGTTIFTAYMYLVDTKGFNNKRYKNKFEKMIKYKGEVWGRTYI